MVEFHRRVVYETPRNPAGGVNHARPCRDFWTRDEAAATYRPWGRRASLNASFIPAVCEGAMSGGRDPGDWMLTVMIILFAFLVALLSLGR